MFKKYFNTDNYYRFIATRENHITFAFVTLAFVVIGLLFVGVTFLPAVYGKHTFLEYKAGVVVGAAMVQSDTHIRMELLVKIDGDKLVSLYVKPAMFAKEGDQVCIKEDLGEKTDNIRYRITLPHKCNIESILK